MDDGGDNKVAKWEEVEERDVVIRDDRSGLAWRLHVQNSSSPRKSHSLSLPVILHAMESTLSRTHFGPLRPENCVQRTAIMVTPFIKISNSISKASMGVQSFSTLRIRILLYSLIYRFNYLLHF